MKSMYFGDSSKTNEMFHAAVDKKPADWSYELVVLS